MGPGPPHTPRPSHAPERAVGPATGRDGPCVPAARRDVRLGEAPPDAAAGPPAAPQEQHSPPRTRNHDAHPTRTRRHSHPPADRPTRPPREPPAQATPPTTLDANTAVAAMAPSSGHEEAGD